MLEEDVASSRRGGGVVEIHDVPASGATAAVTLLREYLIEFEPGRVARWTSCGCAGGDARDALRSPAIAVLNEKLAACGLHVVARWPGRRCR